MTAFKIIRFLAATASLLLIMLAAVAPVSGRSSSSSSTMHLETNDINDIFSPTPSMGKDLPVCAGNTICAYLQANSRGINTQPLCSCQLPHRCPLVWDADDGHSVTQGSDQYKYCRKAPVLRPCQRGMTAYTTTSLLSKSSGRMLSLSDVNHCTCSSSANYDVVDSQFEDVDDDTETMSTTYVCNPLKTCGVGDACKLITETTSTFLVNAKCRCGRETSCPSSAANRNKNGDDDVIHPQQRRFVETVRYGQGSLHMIYCH